MSPCPFLPLSSSAWSPTCCCLAWCCWPDVTWWSRTVAQTAEGPAGRQTPMVPLSVARAALKPVTSLYPIQPDAWMPAVLSLWKQVGLPSAPDASHCVTVPVPASCPTVKASIAFALKSSSDEDRLFVHGYGTWPSRGPVYPNAQKHSLAVGSPLHWSPKWLAHLFSKAVHPFVFIGPKQRRSRLS